MASTSLASFSSSSAHFTSPKFSTNAWPHSPPSRVSFCTPLRVSAACASTAERTRSDTHIGSSPSSLYEVLGIRMGATCQEIRTAYRRLARTLHPDVVSNGQDKEITANEFIKVHEAYATLSDPEKRADYDRLLFIRQGRLMRSQFVMSATAHPVASSSAASRFSGYTRRSWETDQCW